MLRDGLVAGVSGALSAALVAVLAGEGPLQRAIDLEGPAAGALLPRWVQIATVPIVVATVGSVLGVAVAALCRRALPPAASPGQRFARVWGVGASLWVATTLVPALAYPPDPPGVGDPATIYPRTAWYLVSVLAGTAAVLAGWWAARWAGRRTHRPAATTIGVAVTVVGVLLIPAVLPGHAAPVEVPPQVLWDFRVASLLTQSALWGVLTAVLALRAHDRWRSP